MNNGTNNLQKLAKIFSEMPGIGTKFAWKLAFHILSLSKEEILNMSQTILKAHSNTKKCSICQNYTEEEVCAICKSNDRNSEILCVVESPKDVIAFEKTNAFSGKYHVLHGLINPSEGVGPKQLSMKELFLNVKANRKIKEVILATSPTIEGDSTAVYIAKFLKPFGVKISRLAYGISVGSEIQYADSMTILKAIENRHDV